MNINNRTSYYLLLLLFPLSFLLHNINENFGLIGMADIVYLLLVYVIITGCIAFGSKFIFGLSPRAFVFAFVLLLVNFLFGVYKDFARQRHLPEMVNSYTFLLPLLLIMCIVFIILLKKSGGTFTRLSQALAFFLVVNFIVETGWTLYNLITAKNTSQDFGDYHHTVIKDFRPDAIKRKPVVFWMVFDEYAGSSSLKKVWGFHNPLDSMLKAKGFFVAGSASSNYNFTHYSITSTLDMVYLKELSNHAVVRLKDLQRGAFSIYDNNVVQVFEKSGYAINNYTIFPMKDHPASGITMFDYVPQMLINYQTLEGRIQKDIGWNFATLFSRNKRAADSLNVVHSMANLDTSFQHLQNRCLQAIKDEAAVSKPSFNLLHFMLPHEPYMYNPDGTIAFKNGYTDSAQNYILQLQYTNTVVTQITDSILSAFHGKDLVIIIQGDHGFKFKETDPLYDQESCKAFYAVYCSDGDYSPWPEKLTTVNSFRILFNKYFNAGLNLLPDTSFNLYYR